MNKSKSVTSMFVIYFYYLIISIRFFILFYTLSTELQLIFIAYCIRRNDFFLWNNCSYMNQHSRNVNVFFLLTVAVFLLNCGSCCYSDKKWHWLLTSCSWNESQHSVPISVIWWNILNDEMGFVFFPSNSIKLEWNANFHSNSMQ